MSAITIVTPSDDAAELQRQNNFEVTFEFDKGVKEKYKLTTQLKSTDALVLESEKSILNNLSIREVVVGLNHSADLIFLAYNALAKRSLQKDVSGLQAKLLEATSIAIVTMGKFRDKSIKVADNAFSAYKSMLNCREDMAIDQLKRCGKVAEEMANESDTLAAKFQSLASEAQNAAETAINDKVTDQATKKQLQKKLNSTIALVAQTKKLQEQIGKALTEAQDEYIKAQDREKIEGDRAFITGIIGAVMTPLAAGVGAAAQAVIAIKSPLGLPGGFVDPKKPETGSKPTTEKPSAEVEKNNESLSDQLKKKEQVKDDIEEEKKTNDAEIEKFEKISTDNKSSEKQKEDAKQKIDELKIKQADINRRLQQAEQAITTLITGLTAASEAMLQVSAQSHSAMQTASKQKMDFYKHRNELAKQNRDALADLEKYAVEIQHTTEDTNNLSVAIQSLEFAIRALHGVVAALTETSLFWRNMANYCKEKLANTDLVENIELIKKYSVETRKEYYSSEDFISQALINVAQWVALNNVCVAYIQEVNKVYTKVSDNHKEAPSDEQAADQVAKLADKVFKSANDQKGVMEANMQAFNLQMQALTVSAQEVPYSKFQLDEVHA
ncbi:hypothetical protein OGM63_23500 [Plectonema radiosum NIES-515]|uniref:Uncharacterized protein n=1 Tax=Plectonema radiosum NIES-515 TaxID=2986073 RepID=A0ABT3B4Y9_9CYAN|nr:hypothetical protein [Plectonema radiosum]MCV3216442.1 hypothetical protein [Plectonema radiosum NIES-515]